METPAQPVAPVLPDEYIDPREFCRRLHLSESWFDRNRKEMPGVVKLTPKVIRIHWPTFQAAALSGDVAIQKTTKRKRTA